jgi:hypothetical protein
LNSCHAVCISRSGACIITKTANPSGWNLYVIKVEVTGSLFESAAVAVSVKGMDSTSDVDDCLLTSVKVSAILLVTLTVPPPVVRLAVSSGEIFVPFPHEKGSVKHEIQTAF